MKGGAFTMVFLVAATLVPAVGAQAPGRRGPGPGEPELRREMRRYLHARLRAELSLSDEQADAVLPLVDAIEAERRTFRRDRTEMMRRLREGLRSGASDDDLQLLLARARAERIRHEKTLLEMEDQMDRQLNVRQRVQFRFFTQRFRREMEERVRQYRGGRAGGRSSPARPRRPGYPRGPEHP